MNAQLGGTRLQGQHTIFKCNADRAAIGDLAGQNFICQPVLNFALHDPLERSRAIDRIVAAFGQPVARRCGQMQNQPARVDQPLQEW